MSQEENKNIYSLPQKTNKEKPTRRILIDAIVVVLLIIGFPKFSVLGVVLMWVLTKWSRKIKIIVTLAWILSIAILSFQILSNLNVMREKVKESKKIEYGNSTLELQSEGGWKIYKNEVYGYTIEYPKELYVNNINENLFFARSPLVYGTITDEDAKRIGYEIDLAVSSNPDQEHLSIKEWWEKYRGNWPERYEAVKNRPGYKEENIKIGDFEGIKVCDDGWNFFPQCSVYIVKGKYVYRFTVIYYYKELSSEADNIFNKMLSTFRFLE